MFNFIDISIIPFGIYYVRNMYFPVIGNVNVTTDQNGINFLREAVSPELRIH